MAITLTPSAARQIVASVEKFGGIGLRLGVKTVGCSGLAYTFDMAREVGPDASLPRVFPLALTTNHFLTMSSFLAEYVAITARLVGISIF